MRFNKLLTMLAFTLTILAFQSCQRSSNDIWEDSKSCGRHVGRGFRSLGGKHGDSRQIYCRDDFMPCDMDDYSSEFIRLPDDNASQNLAVHRQPKDSPGDPGSPIPGIESFEDPSVDSNLAHIFRNVHFAYNSDLVKGQENQDTIHNIANYMAAHPNTYIFVEGHCDERGPDAYNLALGSRRSNAIRNQLLAEGVSHNNVFTISYGKERPLAYDHTEEAWAKNRRGEFKIYQR